MKKPILILGATSPIARASANAFASKGHAVYLAGRDKEELSRIASDINIRHGVHVGHGLFDAEDYHEHDAFLLGVVREMKDLEGVLLAFGDLGVQKDAIQDFDVADSIIRRNFTGACSILTHCANYFEKQKSGFIIGITSVAGDRGRQSNYVYGAAKGGLSLFLQGLRNRLYSEGVRVISVKPGFVDTGMTYGRPGIFLAASPQYVGERIANSINRSSDVLYVPWFWRYIMTIIKCIPEFVFKRLKL